MVAKVVWRIVKEKLHHQNQGQLGSSMDGSISVA